jgi:hypothetical protein
MLRRGLRRAWGAAAGPLQQHEAGAGAGAAGGAARAAAQQHAGAGGAPAGAAARRAAAQQWRRWMSQDAGAAGGAGAGAGAGGALKGPRSLLDSGGFAHPGGAGPVLGSAAETRMAQLQQEAAAAAAAAAAGGAGGAAAAAATGAAPGGGLSRARRVIGDLLFYGTLAAAAGAGYVYHTHPTKDVEQWLEDARVRAKEESPAWGAWAWVLDHYLDGAHFVDHKVGGGAGWGCGRKGCGCGAGAVGRGRGQGREGFQPWCGWQRGVPARGCWRGPRPLLPTCRAHPPHPAPAPAPPPPRSGSTPTPLATGCCPTWTPRCGRRRRRRHRRRCRCRRRAAAAAAPASPRCGRCRPNLKPPSISSLSLSLLPHRPLSLPPVRGARQDAGA